MTLTRVRMPTGCSAYSYFKELSAVLGGDFGGGRKEVTDVGFGAEIGVPWVAQPLRMPSTGKIGKKGKE